MKSEYSEMEMDQRYELYIQERKILVDSFRQSSQTFDKAVLTVATSSFGATFAILKFFGKTPHENTYPLLVATWGFLILAVLAIMLSFLTSMKACEFQIENCYETLVDCKPEKKNCWGKTTSILNFISIMAIAISYIFWGFFIYWNLH